MSLPPAPTSSSPRLPVCWPAHSVCWHGKVEPRGLTKEDVVSHLHLQELQLQNFPRLPGICWAPTQTPADNDDSLSSSTNHRDSLKKREVWSPFFLQLLFGFVVIITHVGEGGMLTLQPLSKPFLCSRKQCPLGELLKRSVERLMKSE